MFASDSAWCKKRSKIYCSPLAGTREATRPRKIVMVGVCKNHRLHQHLDRWHLVPPVASDDGKGYIDRMTTVTWPWPMIQTLTRIPPVSPRWPVSSQRHIIVWFSRRKTGNSGPVRLYLANLSLTALWIFVVVVVVKFYCWYFGFSLVEWIFLKGKTQNKTLRSVKLLASLFTFFLSFKFWLMIERSTLSRSLDRVAINS